MEEYEDIKERPILNAILLVIILVSFALNIMAFLERTGTNSGDDKAQYSLTSLLDDNFADYSLLDAHCKKSTIGNIDFSAFYMSSDDTLYKCKYDSSSDKLYMQEVSDSPIILSGYRDGEKE